MSSCPECGGDLLPASGTFRLKWFPDLAIENAKWQECRECEQRVFDGELAQTVADLHWAKKDGAKSLELAEEILELLDRETCALNAGDPNEDRADLAASIRNASTELARLTIAAPKKNRQIVEKVERPGSVFTREELGQMLERQAQQHVKMMDILKTFTYEWVELKSAKVYYDLLNQVVKVLYDVDQEQATAQPQKKDSDATS